MANTLKIKRGLAAGIPQGQLAEPLFTTDTYDLYIGKGSGGNQRIQNYIASGTSTQFLKGDGSLDSTSYQTALTFSSPLVNTSGTISIPAATGSVNGYLTSTDWTTFNSKEPAITAGTNLQYYRGDKTFQTLDTSAVPENGPVYFTEPRVRSTVLTGLNLTGGGTIAATDSVLQAFGKIQNQISAIGTGVAYQGTWNANTNTPTITSGVGTAGYYYVVNVAGSTNIDGITDWNIGDWIIFNGTTWDQVDNTDAVSSVNGFTGAVNLALDNISDVSAATPTNAQLLRFNGTSSLWENWTPTFEPALTKGNLTEATSSVLTITGGSNAVIGSGTTIEVKQASSTVNGYLSSTDWTTFNNKQATITLTTTGTSGAATFSSNTLNIPQYQAALTNPVTGTGTSQYLAKFTSTGSAIGDSSMYYSEGANSNEYTFGSIGAGNKYNNSIFNIYSNSNANLYLQFGSNKYANFYNLYGDVGIQVANTGVHSTFSILYFNGTGTRYVTLNTENGEGLRINANKTIRFTEYSTNGFVKTSSSNGTITIDTTTYLPLTGGTLTGALSGTSATFTSNVTIRPTSGYNAYFQTSGTALRINYLNDALSANVSASYRATDFAWQKGDGAEVLSISSTGAATFSSSVTGTQFNASSKYAWGTATNGTTGQIATDNTNNYFDYLGNLYFRGAAASNTLITFTSAGAATFSSSVTSGAILTNGASGTAGQEAIRINNDNGYIGFFNTANSTRSGYIQGNTTDLTIATSPSNPIIFATANVEKMRITSGGNVGIGTSSPEQLFTVAGGSISVSGNTGTPRQILELTTASTVSIVRASYQGAGSYGDLALWTGGSERMRITSGGNVEVTTTTFAQVKINNAATTGANRGTSFQVSSTTNAGTTFEGQLNAISNNANAPYSSTDAIYLMSRTSGIPLIFTTNNGGTEGERMRITSAGNVELNGGSIKTGAPTGGTAKPWKLGARLSGTVSTSTTNYLEVEVDGTLYYLAFAVPL